jgi:hypothetical protein
MGNAIKDIKFTKADHLANEFIHIGEIAFNDPDEAERFWNAIAEDGTQDSKIDDATLLADLWTANSHIDSKYVTASYIESYIGRTIEEAVKDGEDELERLYELSS